MDPVSNLIVEGRNYNIFYLVYTSSSAVPNKVTCSLTQMILGKTLNKTFAIRYQEGTNMYIHLRFHYKKEGNSRTQCIRNVVIGLEQRGNICQEDEIE